MKKIIGVITAIICAICTTGGGVQPLISDISVSAETTSDELSYGDYLKYQKIDEDDDGTYDYIRITDCDESATEIEIPGEIDGLKVTVIGASAFSGCPNLASVNIPDGVTLIGSCAFDYCTSLVNISIPNSVTFIGNMAFEGCTSLTSINIPNHITSIYLSTFYDCISLSNITIPDGVTNIGRCAFDNCTSLTSINIPNSVTNIDALAFESCINLTNIIVPKSVTNINYGAFASCKNLESITIKNPKCVIYDDKATISNICDFDNDEISFNGTIYGYENSTAQAYAEKYGYKFEALEPENEIVSGDITGNGKIDLYDAIDICKYIMGMKTFTEEEMKIADFDGNGRVDLYDVIGIAKTLLG